MLVTNVTGHFDGPTGTVTFDPSDLSTLQATAVIDVGTINTRNRQRDIDLKGPQFFDAAKFPHLKFVSKRVDRLAKGRFTLVGDLTLRGVTKEVVLEVEGPSAEVKDIWGNARVGAVARTTIDRREFGLMYNRLLEGGGAVVGDEVAVTIDLALTRVVTKREER
jgi:polyisoprenoid-binding protein YceI